MRRICTYIISIIFCFLLSAASVNASIGISPADFTFNELIPGTTVEKEFLLSRTETENVTNINVETDVPGADEWFRIDTGTSFSFEDGSQTKSVTVIAEIPEKLDRQSYEGFIYFKYSGESGGAGVSVVAGVGVSVSFQVGDEEIQKLLVRSIEIADISEGDALIAILKTENQGNTETSYDEVKIIVSDQGGGKVLEDSQNKIKKIRPGAVDDLSIEYDINLPEGEYSADIEAVFGGEVIKKEEGIIFKVNKRTSKDVVQGEKQQLSTRNILILSAIILYIIFDIVMILILLRKWFWKKRAL